MGLMKIAIVGAGAIGGYAGVKLALAGERVTFLARGANLEAIRSRGIKLILSDDTELVARDVEATADYSAPGPQDIVILAVKAHQMDAVAHGVPRLFGPATVVLPCRTGFRTGTFMGTAVRSRAGVWRQSTRPASACARSRRRASLAVWSIRPRSWWRPGSSATSKAIVFPWASWTAPRVGGRARCPSASPAPDSKRRCSTTSGRRSGSSSGETSRSIR